MEDRKHYARKNTGSKKKRMMKAKIKVFREVISQEEEIKKWLGKHTKIKIYNILRTICVDVEVVLAFAYSKHFLYKNS